MSDRTIQGAESNYSGQMLERVIEEEFSRRKVPVFQYSETGDNGDLFEPRFLLRSVPYKSIYGCHSRSEFLYRDFPFDIDIRIECRWQQVGGSVDEKMPYLFLNATEAMPERIVWLVLDGGGARSEAIEWLHRRASQQSAKTIRVMGLAETRQRIKLLLEKGAP